MNCRTVAQPTPMWPFRQKALPGLAMFALPLDGYEPPCDAVLMDSRWLGQALPLRRREFAGGRVCAAAALTALGLLDDWLPIARPYRYALFPAGAVGSISHNRSQALACAADAACFIGVGIDIEEVIWHPELGALAAHVMRPEEHKRFQNMEGIPALQFFYLCFSAKESLYKALFPLCHVDLEMSEAELVIWDNQGHFVLTLRSERLSEYFADGHNFHGFWAMEEGTLLTIIPLEKTG
ncbi:4'-phosphopantetheinyl transferase superfamily protein [Pseudomonas sp. AA27]|uniref:4'-phosphopantetheinyl transferase family protein n=1 Tax=Pseudomonas sp. AA27 TaxID=2908652 RepID=UPI001F41FA8C|nr:4'-phosphopantetheinyl transferase superfamily protein [Pseudomonas sp. AA27]MCF1485794.1 4'-phosphopantetheinyl transferase superfamily protein [Pseudomonas sp. AA27]